jgi:hypothetical protein
MNEYQITVDITETRDDKEGALRPTERKKETGNRGATACIYTYLHEV